MFQASLGGAESLVRRDLRIRHREVAGIILARVATAALSYGEQTPASTSDTGGASAPDHY